LKNDDDLMSVEDHLFIGKILEYSEEYEKEVEDLPLREKTVAHFVHWVFKKLGEKNDNCSN
jgi:hypothetical protein